MKINEINALWNDMGGDNRAVLGFEDGDFVYSSQLSSLWPKDLEVDVLGTEGVEL